MIAQRLSSLYVEPKAKASQTLPSEHSPKTRYFSFGQNEQQQQQSTNHHPVRCRLDSLIDRNICQHTPYHKQNQFLDPMNQLQHR